jgi:3-hydroxy-9,10-secoandrosta-1,3,5(10)-triene-9,17-dione monooxygenase
VNEENSPGRVDSLVAVGPVLRAHAADAERANRLSEEAVKALREAGLFRLGVPRPFGGRAAGLTASVEVIAELAKSCPSSSWVVAVSYGAQQIAARFAERTRRGLWADDPDQAFCGSLTSIAASAVRVPGGQIVTGRWGWASGAYQAVWAVLTMPIMDERNEVVDQGVALVPMSDLSIVDTWNMMGMRGTGTNTLTASDVFIPEERILSFAKVIQPAETIEANYRTSLGSLALTFVATMLGATEEVFDATMRVVAGDKPLSDSCYERLADAPSIRSDIANARNLIDSARLHVLRSANWADAVVEGGAELDEVARARLRMDAGYASKALRTAADLLVNVGGASSLSATNPVQRYWRDIHTAARHPTITTELSEEIYGHALVGSGQRVSPLV